jgi:hypothetical protein
VDLAPALFSYHPLRILQQGDKPKIHVQLLMTVEKRQARVVGHKVNFDRPVLLHHHGVFLNSTCLPARHFGQLKRVTVQMNGMRVVTLIVEIRR